MRRHLGTWVLVLLAAAVAAAGCKKSEGSSGAAAEKPGEGAAPAEGQEFRVEAQHADAVKVGETLTAVMSATGVAPWHVNTEYPVKLEIVSAEGFTAPESPMRKGAAAKLDETELRFEVPLAAQEPGERTVELKLKFGLCNADRCISREQVESWTVAVGGE